MKFLMAFLVLSFSSLSYADCKIHAEAVVGVLDFDISNCEIEGKLVEGGGHISGTFSVDLAKLDTGLDLRNEHMHKKYLETEKNPIAVMKLEPVKTGIDKTFKGHLSLHGVTKEVTGEVIESTATSLKAKFVVNITDFGIEKPGYKGITVGEKLNIFVSIP